MMRLRLFAVGLATGLVMGLLVLLVLPASCSAKSLGDWLNPTPSYESALADIQQYNYGDALSTLTALSAKYPESPRYVYDLVLLHQRLGNASQAHTLLQHLNHQFPNSVEAHTIEAALNVVQPISASLSPHEMTVPLAPHQPPATSATSLSSVSNTSKDISPLLRSLRSPENDTERESIVPTQPSTWPLSEGTALPAYQQPQTPAADQTAQMQAMMNQMMLMNMMSGGLGGYNNGSQQQNPMGMMMWPMMMQQMGGMDANTPNATPYGQLDPDTLSTMMMNQVMGNMDFSGGNKDPY